MTVKAAYALAEFSEVIYAALYHASPVAPVYSHSTQVSYALITAFNSGIHGHDYRPRLTTHRSSMNKVADLIS
jgi:hypothetical protein